MSTRRAAAFSAPLDSSQFIQAAWWSHSFVLLARHWSSCRFTGPHVTVSYLKCHFRIRLMQKQSTHIWKISLCTLSVQRHVIFNKQNKMQHAPSQAVPLVWIYLLSFSHAPSGLFLVLSLCGSEEILQKAPQVLEGRPVLWVFPPAQIHDAVELICTVFWLRHSVAPLQVLDYLWVGHTWTTGQM